MADYWEGAARSRGKMVELLSTAAAYLGRQRGIEYIQMAKALDEAARELAHLGRIGPKPPGISVAQWATMSPDERKAMLTYQFEFYDYHKHKISLDCRACGSKATRILIEDDDEISQDC